MVLVAAYTANLVNVFKQRVTPVTSHRIASQHRFESHRVALRVAFWLWQVTEIQSVADISRFDAPTRVLDLT